MSKIDSKIVDWIPELKRYARAIYKKMCSTNGEFKKIVEYHEEAFDKLFEKYLIYRNKLHSLIEGSLIDRHKILAAILLAATDKDNVIFQRNDEAVKCSSEEKFPFPVAFPNQYYLCTILLPILTEYVFCTQKTDKHKLSADNYDIRFPDTTTCWEKDSSQEYSEHFCHLLTTLMHIEDLDTKCLHIMAHLMFFYELAYDCAVSGLKKTYYNIEA
jgi:hypothetical protein